MVKNGKMMKKKGKKFNTFFVFPYNKRSINDMNLNF